MNVIKRLSYWQTTLLLATTLALLMNIVWWRENKLISGADLGINGLSGLEDLKRNVFTWNENQFWGIANAFNNSLAVWDVFFILNDVLSQPLLLERVLFSGIILATFFGMTFLLETIFQKKEKQWLICSLFYTANLFTIISWHNLVIFVLMAYAALPVLLGLLIRSRKKKKFPTLLALTTLLLSPLGVNPPTIIGIIILPLSFYTLFIFVQDRKDIRQIKKNLITAITFTVLVFFLHSWWILPSIFEIRNLNENHPIETLKTSIERNTKNLTLENVLNLGGHWSLYETNLEGKPYFHFAKIYTDTQSPWHYLGLLFPFLAIAGVMRNKNFRKKEWWFWLIFSLFFLFLIKNNNPPFGNVYENITKHIPFFWIFRSPEYKFLPGFILGTTVLLGYAFQHSNQKKTTFNTSLFLLPWIVMYAYPFFTGQLFEEKNRTIEVRERSSDFLTWLEKTEKNDRWYILPQQKGAYMQYLWGYDGLDIVPNVLNRPSGGVVGGSKQSDNLALYINYKIFRQRNEKIITRLFQETNTTYILQRNDVNHSIYPKHLAQSSPYEIAQIMQRMQNVQFLNRFGDWDIYEVKGAKPMIQAYSDTVIWSGPISLLTNLMDAEQNSNPLYVTFDSIKNPQNYPTFSFNLTASVANRKALVDNQGWIVKTMGVDEGEIATGLDSFKKNEIRYRFTIPKDGNYQIIASIKYGKGRGTLNFKINDESWINAPSTLDATTTNPFDYREVVLAEKYFTSGEHYISFTNTEPAEGKGIQELKYFTLRKQEKQQSELTPNIEFQKINPTQWRLHVEDANRPWYLLFRQSFHEGWKLYTVSKNQNTKWLQLWLGQSDYDENHAVGQGFGNSWYIPQTGTYDIIIEFWPQRLRWIGIIASAGTMIMVLVLWTLTRKKLSR